MMKFKEYLGEELNETVELSKMVDIIKKMAVENVMSDHKGGKQGHATWSGKFKNDDEKTTTMKEEAADWAYSIVKRLQSKVLALHDKDFEDLIK